MGEPKSTVIGSMIDFIKGEEGKWRDQVVPPSIGKQHINQLLGRHPFHPYSPDISKDPSHPCHTVNEAFFKCMSSFDGALDEATGEPVELHQKHVCCYHPQKVDLMKCLTKLKREERLKKQQEEAAQATGQSQKQ
jgi:hypothetical protein